MITLFFWFFGFSQKNIDTEITFYISNSYSDDSTYIQKIPIDFDLFYPIYQPITKWVSLQRGSTVTKIKVTNNNISINGNFLLVENGDTLYTKVEERNGHVVFTNQNKTLLFYNKIWQSDFSKKRPTYPTSSLNDSNFSFNVYKNYCHEYFGAEQEFIDTLFRNSRLQVKERLLNTSKNNELTALITPFINGKIVDEKLKVEIDSIVRKDKVRIDRFQSGYILDPSYRNTLSQINYLQAKVIVGNDISPFDYDLLYDNAITSFSKDAYTFLLITYLRRIVRSSNGDYKFITDKIYHQLNTLGLNNKLKYQIDSLYQDFNLLVTNIKRFQDVYLKNSKGTTLKLKNVVDSQKPTLLDFWATWCAPCITEFPYLDTLTKTITDLQIISLSIDKDENKWFKFMKKNQAWDHSSYVLNNPNKSLIVQKYKIEFVPRYILYDKKGNCLSLDLLRPSDKMFIETVKRFLNIR
jgi:thiol-disulfide isomerase/thioredoxin